MSFVDVLRHLFLSSAYDSYASYMLLITFIIGVPYSLIIAWRPFPDGWTWLSVVIGTAFTIIPFAFAIHHYTGSIPLSLLIGAFFIRSGGPMILGQGGKHLVLWLKKRRRQNGHYLNRKDH